MKKVPVNCKEGCVISYNALFLTVYSFERSGCITKSLLLYSQDNCCFGSLDLSTSFLKFNYINGDKVKFYDLVDKNLNEKKVK